MAVRKRIWQPWIADSYRPAGDFFLKDSCAAEYSGGVRSLGVVNEIVATDHRSASASTLGLVRTDPQKCRPGTRYTHFRRCRYTHSCRDISSGLGILCFQSFAMESPPRASMTLETQRRPATSGSKATSSNAVGKASRRQSE